MCVYVYIDVFLFIYVGLYGWRKLRRIYPVCTWFISEGGGGSDIGKESKIGELQGKNKRGNFEIKHRMPNLCMYNLNVYKRINYMFKNLKVSWKQLSVNRL